MQSNPGGESGKGALRLPERVLGDALKRTSLYTGRFALTTVAAAALWLTVPNAWALGLGRLAVQSALGENLRAEIDVTSLTPEEASNLHVRVAPPEAYRSAGVDYGAVLTATQVTLQRRSDGRPYLRVTSDRAVQEPFVDVILEISWPTGRLVREYTLLFDPPTRNMAAAPSPAVAPVVTPPPAPAQPAARAEPAPVAPAPLAAAPAAPESATQSAAASPSASKPGKRKAIVPRPAAPAPEEVAAAPAPSTDQYKVRAGDTLSRIAGRTQRPGVSLDQMLVSLYRGNPQAFIGNNMNRLRSGVVLSVPSADTVQSISASEAREVIQAQSADFRTYREKLAGAVPEAQGEAASRQAAGKVEATIEDKKVATASTPDKLTLSKGTATGKVLAPEDKISKEREKRDAETRVAELSRNVEELKKLSGAAVTPNSKAPAAPQSAPPAVAITAPVTPVAPAPQAAASAPAAASAASEAGVAAAQASSAAASSPVLAAASAASSAAPQRAKPPAVARPTAPVEEPGLLGSIFEDNPLALGLGAAVIALLAGVGVYRFSRRARKDNGETSFLESRLQPDSFFGASGGQRIDTRDAGGASSSMSYSLSQLDAIGDVDPVAEADVYLAYGRDLQAEEILKEAMRSNPERLAIRTKLLEVYAKRRDTKGFESLATQLFGLTQGEGEDWAKAQELGQQIDPENPLYQPGGAPATPSGQSPHADGSALGVSTMPQSVLPTPSRFERANALPKAQPEVNTGNVDLDLDDLATSSGTAKAGAAAGVAASSDMRPAEAAQGLDPVPELPTIAVAPAHAPAPEFAMDFDLSGISLDLDSNADVAPRNAAAAAQPEADLSGIDFAAGESGDGDDPLARKLELAEEFRQIGDMEGARDLLQEVVSKASGALRSKAQGMLNSLA